MTLLCRRAEQSEWTSLLLGIGKVVRAAEAEAEAEVEKRGVGEDARAVAAEVGVPRPLSRRANRKVLSPRGPPVAAR